MGHNIEAFILKGPYDMKVAAKLDLSPIPIGFGLTMFPICVHYLDELAERENFTCEVHAADDQSDEYPVLDGPEIGYIVKRIAPGAMYAVIQTDYVGGHGSQASVVYQGEKVVLCATRKKRGPINNALTLLGVQRSSSQDEFDVIGLRQYRHFENLFERYYQD